MYEELVKRLRQLAAEQMFDFERNPYLQAADAIEERCQQVDKFAAEAARLYAKQPRWIPVTERLPDQNSENLYICLIVGGEYNQLSWYELCDFTERQFCIQDQLHKGHVTHWMQLPQPPEEETE